MRVVETGDAALGDGVEVLRRGPLPSHGRPRQEIV
jgi:hypothetical protein